MGRTIIMLSLAFIFMLLSLGTALATREESVPNRIIVAHSATYPPFSFIDENGQPDGYLIDIWRAFGQANNTAVEFKLGTWQESLDMVKNGVADIHGGLFFNQERDRFLDYGPTITDLSTHLYSHIALDKKKLQTAPIAVIHKGFGESFVKTPFFGPLTSRDFRSVGGLPVLGPGIM